MLLCLLALTVVNGGFEAAAPDGSAVGWRVEGGDGVRAGVSRDTSQAHAGGASLLLDNAAPRSLTVASDPVTLQVGHVYRLTAHVRTAGVAADPLTRYPTAVAAALTMASFPFTNHSPTVAGDSPWTEIRTLFVATQSRDAVRLHLGLNGTATGRAWIDEVALSEVEDIAEYIPLETVRWSGEGYRYDDRGWIFLHVEGAPYVRGWQTGQLLSEELVTYMEKLAIQENAKDPLAGWNGLRHLTDALLLRRFDEELLKEMRGTAEGAAAAGARYGDRPLDLLDIATLNSVVDLGQLAEALHVTPHALSNRSFLAADDELAIPDREHKCSSFAANGPATADGRVVFGQLFMWSGYTGVHFNVIADVVPTTGQRLVFQTFPGGIHSGTDFYMNDAGLVFGETTTRQTPFEPSGTPQSNRARRAAQYAKSIDDVARILREGNNGLYTNDWPMADVKSDEVAILLLGTRESRLWRSGEDPAPFGTPGFFFSNNTARDAAVRGEYARVADGASADLAYAPMNRDLAFVEAYGRLKGRLDGPTAARMWATSPLNRPHACDGKVTTAEMIERLVFMAHYGKVTLREKFPSKEARRMPDLPGAIPHLTLGYSVASPVFITEQLKRARGRAGKDGASAAVAEPKAERDTKSAADVWRIDAKRLWRGTVLPASDAENWLVSGAAAYRAILAGLPADAAAAERKLRQQLGDISNRYLWVTSREADLTATEGRQVYDRYGPYQIPRIKGTFLLHQLRLLLGNQVFLSVMNELHTRYAGRSVTTAEFVALAGEVAHRPLDGFVRQWLDRTGLPDPRPTLTMRPAGRGRWGARLEVTQPAPAYHLRTQVVFESAAGHTRVDLASFEGERAVYEAELDERPTRVVLNPGFDFPLSHPRFYVVPNITDEFEKTLIVYGTSRQDEANRTLGLRFQTTLAEAFTETLLPLRSDAELSDAERASHNLIVLGGPSENRITERLLASGIAAGLPLTVGKNHFRWMGRLYARSDEGLLLALPDPEHPERAVFLYLANSALELYEMTRLYTAGLPSWVRFQRGEIKEQGHYPVGLCAGPRPRGRAREAPGPDR